MKPVEEIIAGWSIYPEDPNLSAEERKWLAQACQPGMPMWKVLKSAFDFAEHLRDHIAATPLTSEEQIRSARQLQTQREAALNFLKWVALCAQQQPEKVNPNVVS